MRTNEVRYVAYKLGYHDAQRGRLYRDSLTDRTWLSDYDLGWDTGRACDLQRSHVEFPPTATRVVELGRDLNEYAVQPFVWVSVGRHQFSDRLTQCRPRNGARAVPRLEIAKRFCDLR